MTSRVRYYVVVRIADPFDRVLAGIPTPGLISEGRGEAYYVPSTEDGEGIWYLRDDAHGYTAPDGVYTRVRVIRNPEDR